MTAIQINLSLDNDAFQDGRLHEELASVFGRIQHLMLVANRLGSHEVLSILDSNGNSVGRLVIYNDEPDRVSR